MLTENTANKLREMHLSVMASEVYPENRSSVYEKNPTFKRPQPLILGQIRPA